MRRTSTVWVTVALAAGLGTVGLSQSPPPAGGQAWRLAEAPAELKAVAQRTEQAFTEYQKRLLARVVDVMSTEGPVAAISVYRDEDAQLAETLARRERFIRMGRTSHRLRSYRNAPPDWAAPYVNETAAADFVTSPTWVVQIGPAVGVLSPLQTTPTCTACHGPVETLSKAMLGAIRAKYPGDQATGFTTGEVRGWIWAEVSSRTF